MGTIFSSLHRRIMITPHPQHVYMYIVSKKLCTCTSNSQCLAVLLVRCDHDPLHLRLRTPSLLFQGSGNLDAIQIIKKLGGNLADSYLDEGWHV